MNNKDYVKSLTSIAEHVCNENSYAYYDTSASVSDLFKLDETLIASNRNLRIIKSFFSGKTAHEIADNESLSVGRVCDIIKSDLMRSGFIKMISNNKFLSARSYSTIISKLLDNDAFINDVYTRYNVVLNAIRECVVNNCITDKKSAILFVMLSALDVRRENKLKLINNVFALYNKDERSVSAIAQQLKIDVSFVNYVFKSRRLNTD